MSKQCRPATNIGVLHLEDIDWHLRVYLMLGNPTENIDRRSLFDNLAEKVRVVAAEYLSDEFKYMRTGFILSRTMDGVVSPTRSGTGPIGKEHGNIFVRLGIVTVGRLARWFHLIGVEPTPANTKLIS